MRDFVFGYIKKKYNVNKVYVPSELDIVKETTYDKNIKSNKEIITIKI